MTNQHAVVIFLSTSHALRAEKILLQKGIRCKLIPVPRQISSDCGVSIRIQHAEAEAVRRLLEQVQLEFEGIHTL